MIKLVDQLQRPVELKKAPTKIVSLVPSLTEYVCSIDADNQLAGISKFCIHPHNLKKKVKVIGGTKNPNLNKIRELEPDLIIANKEENRKEDILALAIDYPVYVSDINKLSDSYQALKDIAILCGRKEKGLQIIEQLKSTISQFPKLNQTKDFVYLIWKNPYIAVGPGTYIHALLNELGWNNKVTSSDSRYPEWNLEDGNFHILLSSEPYPFKEEDKKQIQQVCPNATVELVNGEAFSWYGSRLLSVAEDLNLSKND